MTEWTKEWKEVQNSDIAPNQITAGGFNCGVCGCWVFWSSPHYCGGSLEYFTPAIVPEYFIPPTQITYQDPTLIESQNLLKRLIERVDQLIERVDRLIEKIEQ